MNGNSDTRMEKVMLGEPITDTGTGLTFHPIRMREYGLWTVCKAPLILRQSTLPPEYVSLPYLSAVYALDAAHGFQIGLTYKLLKALSMATLLPEESIQVSYDGNDNTKLVAFVFDDNGQEKRIVPKDFPRIRQLIAEQNGEELPDESENPELVQAEQDILAANAPKVKFDFETMLDSVGLASGHRKKELLDMTVREFDRLRSAINRDKNFTIYSTGEMGGMVKFKNGNPYPSWCFDKKKEGNAALEPLSNFAQRTGIQTAET